MSSPHYEKRDLKLKPILALTLGAVLVMFGTVFMIGVFLKKLQVNSGSYEPIDQRGSTAGIDRLPSAPPKVDQNLRLVLQKINLRDDERLSTYGWSDKKKGTVHIPIEEAMKLVLKEGFPSRRSSEK